MLDYLDSIGYTNKRQHETKYTCWHCLHNHGLLFDSREAAAAYANSAAQPISIYEPLYRG